MPVLITEESVLESAQTISQKGYFKKLNVTTIKGKTSCKTKKDLVNFMVMQVMAYNVIEVTTGDCECLKEEFDFTQDCIDAN